MKLYADKLLSALTPNHKFYHLSSILIKEEYINLLLKMAINKGDSIIHKNNNNN
jgi:hypothetical protein